MLPASYLAAATVVLLLSVFVYRYYFYPLAKVLSLALVAITHLYTFFFNNANNSKYYTQIKKLY